MFKKRLSIIIPLLCLLGLFATINFSQVVKQGSNSGTASSLSPQAADTVIMNATGGSAAPTAVAMPTCTTGTNLYNTTTHTWSCVSPTLKIFGASFSNNGAALVAGATAYFTEPNACTINAWNIVVSPADTATLDIWKIASGTSIPTISNTITASALPAISTGTAVHSTTLTGWSTTVSTNDIFGINLKTAGGVATQLTISLECL